MQSLNKTNLADTAAEAIRAEILGSRWAVGDKLPNEATLSAMLSVSRSTVREAVRVLASQGIVETRQGSGTYVRSTTGTNLSLTTAKRASLREQFEARLALDVEAARLAALRCSAADIDRLRSLLAKRGDYVGVDKDAFVARDFAFHQAVIATSRNNVLISLYEFSSRLIAETIAATLCTLPILLYSFGYMSNVAIFANMLILPLVPLAMLLTFIGGAGGLLVPGIAMAIGGPAYLLLSYMVQTTEFFAGLSWARSEVTVQIWQVVLMYVLLLSFGIFMWWRTRLDLRQANIVE